MKKSLLLLPLLIGHSAFGLEMVCTGDLPPEQIGLPIPGKAPVMNLRQVTIAARGLDTRTPVATVSVRTRRSESPYWSFIPSLKVEPSDPEYSLRALEDSSMTQLKLGSRFWITYDAGRIREYAREGVPEVLQDVRFQLSTGERKDIASVQCAAFE